MTQQKLSIYPLPVVEESTYHPKLFTMHGHSERNNLTEPLLRSTSEQSSIPVDERLAQDRSPEHHQLQQERSRDGREEQQEPISRNIIYTLIYSVLIFSGRSIWNTCVLPNYVYLLVKDNPEAVGFISAVNGLAQLAASIPAGWAADKYRRDTMLKLASSVGILAITATLAALHFNSYQLLTCALSFWGIMWGVSNPSLSALFADSIQDGERTKYFTHRQVLRTTGTTVGPILALILFFFLGDKWTIRECTIVMAVGQLICLPAVLLLLFFNDDYVPVVENHSGGNEDDNDTDLTENPIENVSLSLEGNGESTYSMRENIQQQQQTEPDFTCFCIPKNKLLPVLIVMGDVAGGLSAGLAVRYVPIFFMDNLHLNPVLVQVLFLLPPLGQIILMKTAQFLSKKFGRLRVHIAHKFIGITFLGLMIVSYVYGLPTWCTCFFFILRTCFMRSTGALIKSALMDSVPSHERAKWSALESVNTFTWSGSAAVGGLFVKYDGIIFDFIVTGSLQLLATLPIIAAFSLDKEGRISNEEALVPTSYDNIARDDESMAQQCANMEESTSNENNTDDNETYDEADGR